MSKAGQQFNEKSLAAELSTRLSGFPVDGTRPVASAQTGPAKTVVWIDAGDEVRVRHPMDALLAFGHDLGLSVQALQPPEHVLQAQLIVLHQAFHHRHLHQLAVGRALYPSEGRW